MDRRVFVCVSLSLENTMRDTIMHLWVVTACLILAILGIYVAFIMATGRQGNLVIIVFLALIAVPLGLISTHYGIF